MPVDSHSHSGVCTVTAGSSTTMRGMIPGCRINSLTRCRSSVTPEIALNSPADNVVGTVTCGTVGGFMSGGGPSAPSGPLTGRSASIASALVMSLARQSCTALAPSVIEPPPTVAIKSAFASRAMAAASITACRGVCGGIWSNSPANRLPSARRTLAISSVVRFNVPLTIRKTRLASRRRASSATVSAAGLPKVTASIAPNATRPDCSMAGPPSYGSHHSAKSARGAAGRTCAMSASKRAHENY